MLSSSITLTALEEMPIAVETDKAKSQHYELPTSFFKLVLGNNLKYSCCYFDDKTSTLEDAENAMLELYCERAQLKDGQKILDIGCGWGSFSIYVAKKYKLQHYRNMQLSNTKGLHRGAMHLELSTVEIIVADISNFEMEASFDRVISIGIFEHMKNYKKLLKKISKWMKEDGFLFINHFCHKAYAYHFEDDVAVQNHWLVKGTYYARTRCGGVGVVGTMVSSPPVASPPSSLSLPSPPSYVLLLLWTKTFFFFKNCIKRINCRPFFLWLLQSLKVIVQIFSSCFVGIGIESGTMVTRIGLSIEDTSVVREQSSFSLKSLAILFLPTFLVF
ncbi:(S)-coclaurine N-methyltransferase [Canna indica]|uniref:(S)-coclaurine N-methyltransferase n=1 Tax=Canna indica TaxID=4628 RepID=A0AAQ3KHW3_9LILI|nr:(S)-coclaurine N-methyltransferase [Canna indica]